MATVEEQLRDYFEMVDREQGAVELPRRETAPTLRLVDEHDVATPNEIVVEDKSDSRSARSNRVAARAALLTAAAAAIIVGLVTFVDPADEPAPTDDPIVSLPRVEPPTVEPPSNLGFSGMTIDAGRYRTDLLGVALTLDLDDRWSISEAGVMIALHQPAGEVEIDVRTARWILMTRVGGWNSGAEAIDPAFRGTGSIAPTDVDRWIDDNDVVVLERREIEVDGQPTIVLDVQVDPSGVGAPLDFPRDPHTLYNDTCDVGTAPCVWYRSGPPASERPIGPRPDPVMHTGQTRRMWVISIGGFEPLLIEAVVPEGDEAWLDTFESTTIDTLDLGNDAPPVSIG